MHVLVLPSWYPETPEDLAGSFFREQAIALARAGVCVGVVAVCLRSLRRPLRALLGPFGVRFDSDENVNTVRVSGINWFPKIHTLSELHELVLGIIGLHAYVRKFGRPDLIHVQSMLAAGMLAKWAKIRYGIPYVVTEHSSSFHNMRLSKRQRSQAATIVQNADGLSVVSRSLGAMLARTFHVEHARWQVIPNMVANEFLAPPLRDVARKNECPFTFITVSYLKRGKRVADILRAFAEAFPNAEHVRLRVVGDGECKEDLVSLACNLNIRNRVVFEGARDRASVACLMRDSDAYVLASESETFGVVLIEALASGVPVLATRCGGPEDIVGESDGLLVDVDDVQQLALRMQEIFLTIGNYQPNMLRANCARRFSEETVSRQLLQFYASALVRDCK